jgi:phage FluMu protein Com
MSLPNNPLRQFFRRPAVFLTLPSSGKYYEEGVISPTENGELPVYPMTAIDEITARTPDALFNGEAITQIIKSCIPNILQPWAINNIDLDAILIAIRSASGDNNMEMNSECPKCSEVNPYAIDLNTILPQLRSPNFDKTLDINGLKIKFRPLTYKELNQVGLDQFNIQRTFASLDNIQDDTVKAAKTKEALEVVTNTTMKLVATAIEYIDIGNGTLVKEKDFIIDYLQNCDKNVYTELRDYTAKLREETQIPPLHIKCPNCSNEYDQPFTLNLTDFFG